MPRTVSLTQRALAALLLIIMLAACGGTTPAAPQPTASVVAGVPVQPTAAAAPVATVAPVIMPTTAPALPAPTVAPVDPAPIDPAPVDPATQRIQFAPGATSATVAGAVVRGTRNRYLLYALADQQMALTINSPEHNAVFTLLAPDGQAFAGTADGDDATAFSGKLPLSGDYLLSVGPTRGNASYILNISITALPPPATGNLRATNWAQVLAADPQLSNGNAGGQPYVAVIGADPGVGGIPLFDQIVYLDMDGDGIEEAAIPLASGGTAGNLGFLLYRAGTPVPTLADWRGGYKLALSVESGQLVARSPIYVGWEPNCCPSGAYYQTYVLQGGRLAVVAERSEGLVETQVATVQHFYDRLGQQDLTGAYALLASEFQAANPYDTWAAGYATTQQIQVSVLPDPAAAGVVWVDLTAVDATADGGQITRRFAGTWQLQWDAQRPGWTLANPQMSEVS